VLLILFMVGTYVFIRTDYLVAVIMTTPYVLLLFHLLYPIDFHTILSDRVIDTLIGSVISFLANILIIPSWEHERINDFMTAAIEANTAYFRDVAGAFLGKPSSVNQYKLSRKNAFVALANLSDAFGRMLSEPRRQQKRIAEMHQFVVSNHMLTSHTATLAYYVEPFAVKYADAGYQPLVDDIIRRLDQAVSILRDQAVAELPPSSNKEGLRILNEKVDLLMEQRKAELDGLATVGVGIRKQLSEFKPIADQFNFIVKVSADIEKLSVPLHMALTAPQEVGYTPLV
jgi:uncharacterized membrane protein YccC